MSCKECEERRRLARDALLRSAVGEAAKGAAGIKKKTATADRKKAGAKRKKRTGSTKTTQE